MLSLAWGMGSILMAEKLTHFQKYLDAFLSLRHGQFYEFHAQNSESVVKFLVVFSSTPQR